MLHDWLRCGGCVHLFSLPDLSHPVDDRGQVQVRPGPRGVHLRSSQPVPGRDEIVPLHPHDSRWIKEIKLVIRVKQEFSDADTIWH